MLGVVAWFMIAGTVACLAAIATNLDWWRDRGVDFILDAQVSTNPRLEMNAKIPHMHTLDLIHRNAYPYPEGWGGSHVN